MGQASTESSLLAAVRTAIDTQHLFPDSGVVVVGVSGGPDSVSLLHLLKSLCGSAGPYARISLHVAHLDHGLRGEAGRADAAFVADLAAQWGLPCALGQEDVPALARKSHRSLEDAARQARYAFLRRVAANVGAERIAVAHQADDQVETLVMHWLRGSGLAGLAGMQPLEGDIIRPLLRVSRAEVLRYCEQRQLAYCEDASNQDRRFLRNRIRHDLLTVLEQYNPNLRETLLRNAAVLAEDDAYMQAQVAARWSDVIISETEHALEGDVSVYRRLPLALRRRVLLRAGLQASGGAAHLELRHLEAVDALLARASGAGVLHLPGGLRLRRIYERFRIYEWSTLEHPAESDQSSGTSGASTQRAAVPLAVPGEARLPHSRWLVRAHVLDKQTTPPPGYEQRGSREQWGYIDLDALEAYQPLHVRTRRAGDRFRGLGMPAAKKLQDVLVDAKVPRAERDALPLVCGADESILWVAGYRIADVLKLTQSTRRVLALELEAVP
ncbi:MAG TPA: tRNA lysidine(34) synthetase TilS [Ktedonobacterales bacterium]|nr:tRNA lysidine(34) synthetase TilS [Ktedonobacterales bacterium]